MGKPLQADWHEVKTLALAIGVREAARQMGLPEDAVRQRCSREGWLTSRHEARSALSIPKAKQLEAAYGQPVTNPVTTAAQVLASLPGANKALANSLANRALNTLSEMDDEMLVTAVTTETASSWIRNAEKAGGWNAQERQPGDSHVINVNLLCVQPDQMPECPVVDETQ